MGSATQEQHQDGAHPCPNGHHTSELSLSSSRQPGCPLTFLSLLSQEEFLFSSPQARLPQEAQGSDRLAVHEENGSVWGILPNSTKSSEHPQLPPECRH